MTKNSNNDDASHDDAKSIKSPCIRNCCLTNNDICLGCFRHLDEIIGWQKRSDEDKKQILKACDIRKNETNKNTD